MLDENINLFINEAEKQRYEYSMLPTQLLIKGIPECKSLVKQLTKGLSKIPKKRQVQVAVIFDNLATTQKKGSINKEDINLEKGKLIDNPYETILRMFGAETAKELLKHTKIMDTCLSEKLNTRDHPRFCVTAI